MHASVRLDHSLLALEREHEVNAMLELAAPEAPASEERAPLSLALVLDVSGSMTGPKLDAAAACARWLVSRLRSDARLALVTFDDRVRLLTPLLPIASGAHAHALGALAGGGSTNLSGGWLKGLEALRRAPRGHVRKIVLLTDGLANVGVTEPGALVEITRRAAADGIATTTIGFGADFDEDLLTAMADAGGANAHFAPTPDAAPAIFAAELEGLTSLVAQNVSVEIRPAEDVEVVAVLNEYPAQAVPGGVEVTLGDAYGGEKRRVVLVLRIPHLAALGPAAVAELVVRYVGVGDEIAAHELTLPLVANAVSADEAAAAEPDRKVQEQVIVLKAARARDDAIRLADEGRYEAAQALLAETAKAARHAGLADEAAALEGDLGLAAPAAYAADGMARKQLRYGSTARRRRRA